MKNTQENVIKSSVIRWQFPEKDDIQKSKKKGDIFVMKNVLGSISSNIELDCLLVKTIFQSVTHSGLRKSWLSYINY